jgi:hypothetical protein
MASRSAADRTLFLQVTKQNVFFFAVMGPVCIGSDKVNDLVDMQRVNFSGFLRLLEHIAYLCEHPFNEPVFDHEWSPGLHALTSWL